MSHARDADDVAEAVSAAGASARPLEIVGRGSKRELGRPIRADAVLDVSALSGIVLYEPEELVLTARAGTPLREIAENIARAGQQLAFEPPDHGPLWGLGLGEATLGGCIATGWGGSRRPFAGSVRDHFLGFKAVNGRGKPYAAGGRVVKNVTGFDLPKLLCGSFGTLGVLTEVTIKVLPAPERTLTLVVPGLMDGEAIELLHTLAATSAQITGSAHLPRALLQFSAVADVASAATSLTLVRLEGIEPSVLARARALEQIIAQQKLEVSRLETAASMQLWREITDARFFAADRECGIWRISVPPASGPSMMQAMACVEGSLGFYDWGGGLLWIGVPPAPDAHARMVREALRRVVGRDGHATLVRAPAAVRESISPFEPLAPELLALTQRIKDQFDPLHVLNPGRKYAEF